MATIDNEERACSATNRNMKKFMQRLAVIETDCAYFRSKAEVYRKEVRSHEEEKELERLSRRWMYDSKGRRVTPSPEEEALRVTRELADHPEAENDVFRLLQEKKTRLQMEVNAARSFMLKSEQEKRSRNPLKKF